MTSEDLLRFIEAPPFEPFTAFMADGRQIQVRHREMVASGRFGLSMRLLHDTGQVEVFDGAQIISICTMHPSSKPFPDETTE